MSSRKDDDTRLSSLSHCTAVCACHLMMHQMRTIEHENASHYVQLLYGQRVIFTNQDAKCSTLVPSETTATLHRGALKASTDRGNQPGMCYCIRL